MIIKVCSRTKKQSVQEETASRVVSINIIIIIKQWINCKKKKEREKERKCNPSKPSDLAVNNIYIIKIMQTLNADLATTKVVH